MGQLLYPDRDPDSLSGFLSGFFVFVSRGPMDMDIYEGDHLLAIWAVNDGGGRGIVLALRREGEWCGEFDYWSDSEDKGFRWPLKPPSYAPAHVLVRSLQKVIEQGCFVVQLIEPIRIGCVELNSDDLNDIEKGLLILKSLGFIRSIKEV